MTQAHKKQNPQGISPWPPHITVACIVEHAGKFLMVEEDDGQGRVFNQPAGHLEPGETLFAAALRETLEETRWHVKLKGFIGLYVYHSPLNNTIYHRHCFLAEALREDEAGELDEDIKAVHWMSYEQISASSQLRSPLVLHCLDDYRERGPYPLALIQ